MTTRREMLTAAGLLGVGAFLSSSARASAPTSGVPVPIPRPDVPIQALPVRVYLFRGLFELFSYGLDDLARKFRNEGRWAEVYGLGDVEKARAEILARQKTAPGTEQFVLIGHSWGGDISLEIADALFKQGGQVELIAAFDAVTQRKVGPGVRRFVNYYQSSGGWSKPIETVAGFAGTSENKDLALGLGRNHLNIERSPDLHTDIMARVASFAPPVAGNARTAGR
ncbi:MAG: hypothetical protein WCH83_13675 [Alphaproteobacteria bacterium]